MKFNERELRFYGSSTVGNVDQEGYLWKRGERSRDVLPEFSTQFISPLLYGETFRVQYLAAEPVGCIVLERVSVFNDQSSDRSSRYCFRLEFDSSDARVYFLSALTDEARQSWVSRIRQASFEYLRNTLTALQSRLWELTGRTPTGSLYLHLHFQDPFSDSFGQWLVPDVAAPEPDRNVFRQTTCSRSCIEHTLPSSGSLSAATFAQHSYATTPDDTEFDISYVLVIECFGLPMQPNPKKPHKRIFPTTFVTVQRLEGDQFIPIGRTEIIEQTTIPKFRDPITISPAEVQASTLIRFQIFNQSPLNPAQPNAKFDDLNEMIDHTVHTQDLLAENSSVAAINFPGQISAQSVDEHPSSFRLFDVSATAPAILGDEKTNLNVLSDSSSDDPEVSTLLTDENISGTIMNSHPKPLLTSKYGKTQPVVLTRNSIMCEEDEKPYVSNGDDDDDAGNNSDSSIELSNTNPFKQELLQSLQDEDTINPEVRAELLGTVDLPTEILLDAFISSGIVVQEIKFNTGEKQQQGNIHLRCRQTTVKFLKTPKMEDAPVFDENEDQHAKSSRPPVAYIDQCKEKIYRIPQLYPTNPNNMQEIMRESPYFRTIPMQLVQCFIEEDKKHLQLLDQIELVGPLQKVKRAMYDRVLQRQLLYQDRKAQIDGFSESFKPSRLKKKPELEMLTTNLHTQLLRVETVDGTVHTYETLTLGCPAAHSLGFKNGGLTSLMREMNQHELRPKKGLNLSKYKVQLEELASTFKQWKEQLFLSELRSDNAFEVMEGLHDTVEGMASLLQEKLFIRIHSEACRFRPQKPNLDMYINDPKKFVSTLMKAWNDLETAITDSGKTDQKEVESALRALTWCYENCYYEVQECIYVTDVKQNEHTIEFTDVVHRHDIIFSQALTALVTSFISTLRQLYRNEDFISQLSTIGFLFHVSSFLSTHGSEYGMLEDSWEAMQLLSKVKFTLSRVQGTKIDPMVQGTRNNIIVDIGISGPMMDCMSKQLEDHIAIPVRAVLFTQGINEMQTVANSLGYADLQDTINEKSVQLIEAYAAGFIALFKDRPTAISNKLIYSAQEHIGLLKKAMQSRKQKNIELLFDSEKLARLMNAGRATMCKSGKDRSSMAVTLETALLLQDHHNFPRDKIPKLLENIRSKGTRVDNVSKNINDTRYAFNRLQIMTLPKLLRPPEGTYGASHA
eukprot:gene5622-196_t